MATVDVTYRIFRDGEIIGVGAMPLTLRDLVSRTR
jgi:hypothetical protein